MHWVYLHAKGSAAGHEIQGTGIREIVHLGVYTLNYTWNTRKWNRALGSTGKLDYT